MPRKPAVPTIPEKPTGKTKPERSRVVSKHRPDPGPEQFDLWGAFDACSDLNQAVEVAPQRRAKARACPQLSQMMLAARWTAARKLRAVLS
jgi:hypothetical protein